METNNRRFITQGKNVPPSSAPISQAVVVGKICYVSGQLAVDADGQFQSGTAQEEAERAFANLFAVVEAAGFKREEIIFVDVAFINLKDLPIINALFVELFAEGRKPARTVYQAAELPAGAKIKVLAMAVKD